VDGRASGLADMLADDGYGASALTSETRSEALDIFSFLLKENLDFGIVEARKSSILRSKVVSC
jgi:hypothetical protein